METDENSQEYNTGTKKKIVIWSIIVLMIILISVFMYFFVKHESSEHSIYEFKKDIINKNYKSISATLSKNGNDVSKEDAKKLISYLLNVKGKASFEKEIDNIVLRAKNEGAYNVEEGFGSIEDNRGRPIITFKKDGKRLIFLDKVYIEPSYVHVHLPKDEQESTYKYRYNGKNYSVQANRNKGTDIGKFIVGKYNIESTKKYTTGDVKGESKGRIKFNTEDFVKGKKVVASTHYNTYSIKPLLKNSDKLDKDSLKIFINENQNDYKPNKVYGKYPTSETISVYATGKFNGTVFTTETEYVDLMSDEEMQSINLSFDKSKIKKEIHQQKEEKKKVEKFMEDYTRDLTKGYKKGEYKYVSKYFDKGSNLESHIKSMIKTKKKTKFKDPKVTDITVDGSRVLLKLSKSDNKHNKIKSKYELRYINGDFKIIDYKDV